MVRWSSQITVFSTRTSQWGEEQNLLTIMRMVMIIISTNTMIGKSFDCWCRNRLKVKT